MHIAKLKCLFDLIKNPDYLLENFKSKHMQKKK